jgi:uncharacterized protein YgbK (DUF1537 family)
VLPVFNRLSCLTSSTRRRRGYGAICAGWQTGAVIVGSHVKKTTQQLEKLLQEPGILGIEVEVARLVDDSINQSATLLKETLTKVQAAHNSVKRQ